MATGFFTDATLCIGCKACEVACKQWNELPADGFEFTGDSYDNTSQLSGTTWRHVAFVETTRTWRRRRDGSLAHAQRRLQALHGSRLPRGLSDRRHRPERVRKRSSSSPTSATVAATASSRVRSASSISSNVSIRWERQYNLASLNENRREENRTALAGSGGVAGKCTLCYDRQKARLRPGVRESVPDRIHSVRRRRRVAREARERVARLQERGVAATLYGADDVGGGIGPLNAFFLLTGRPGAYNLPAEPVLPSTRQRAGYTAAALAAFGLALAGWAIFRAS